MAKCIHEFVMGIKIQYYRGVFLEQALQVSPVWEHCYEFRQNSLK
jgi:hypothetical protein